MMRFFYTTLVWAIQPFLRRKLQRRGQKEAGYLEAIEERFGHYTAPAELEKNLVWVHAVSLGESRAAAVLIEALRTQQPKVRILLTHGTATGRAQGKSVLREGDVQVWQPWDTPAIVRRFLHHFKPQVALVLETEVWPNWVAECQQAQVPVLLVNARMSDKSQQQAKRLSWLSRPAYLGLSGAWAQTEADAARLRDLGAHVKGVTGNLKFDAKPDPRNLALALLWKERLTRPVVMLSSSREGEEQMWLDALQALSDQQLQGQAHLHDVQWLIVPRHPQRFDEVATLLAARGWQVSRRSEWQDGPPLFSESSADSSPVVWLGDSLGEMALYYGLSDAALLGGSFEPYGGQNLIEATACGCPVVMGPHTFNFAEAAELAQDAGAALRVQDMAQGMTTALQLVISGADENAYVAACLAFSQAHRGAAQRTVEAVLPYVKERAKR
jgi:3-deoxy-D-manno-octulosonic-acid transferase